MSLNLDLIRLWNKDQRRERLKFFILILIFELFASGKSVMLITFTNEASELPLRGEGSDFERRAMRHACTKP